MAPAITAESLMLIAPEAKRDRARLYAAALDAVSGVAGLTTAMRVAHFMAQAVFETSGFQSLVESVAYLSATDLLQQFGGVTDRLDAEQLISAGQIAIGDRIYGDRLGNGPPSSGDGYRFRGRGFLMQTGRAAYQAMEDLSGEPLIKDPARLGIPAVAAEAFALLWAARDINRAADADDLAEVTLRLRGAPAVGLAARADWLARAKRVWL